MTKKFSVYIIIVNLFTGHKVQCLQDQKLQCLHNHSRLVYMTSVQCLHAEHESNLWSDESCEDAGDQVNTVIVQNHTT